MDGKVYVCISKGKNCDPNNKWKVEDSKIWWIQTNQLSTILETKALEQEAFVTFFIEINLGYNII